MVNFFVRDILANFHSTIMPVPTSIVFLSVLPVNILKFWKQHFFICLSHYISYFFKTWKKFFWKNDDVIIKHTVPWDAPITHAHASTHTSKFMCAIYPTHEVIVFSLFVLLLSYISRKEKYMLKWAVSFFTFTFIAESA